MQNYLNHFLGNIDIVCKFLEVSRLLFSPEYGSKLKEDYVLVQHLIHIQRDDANSGCYVLLLQKHLQKHLAEKTVDEELIDTTSSANTFPKRFKIPRVLTNTRNRVFRLRDESDEDDYIYVTNAPQLSPTVIPVASTADD